MFTFLIILLTVLALFSVFRGPNRIALANISEGTHQGTTTKKADGVINRNILLKLGSDAKHVTICTAADIPIGISEDEADEAEDLLHVHFLGASDRTKVMTASEAITAGEDVYTAAAGKAQDLPVAAGTYYHVGRALTAATGDGVEIEVETCVPEKLVVIAALTSADTDLGSLTLTAPDALTVGADIGVFTDPPSAAEMALLRTFVNALKADVTALRATVNTHKTEGEAIADAAEVLADDVREIAVAATGGNVKIL